MFADVPFKFERFINKTAKIGLSPSDSQFRTHVNVLRAGPLLVDILLVLVHPHFGDATIILNANASINGQDPN